MKNFWEVEICNSERGLDVFLGGCLGDVRTGDMLGTSLMDNIET